MLPDSGTLEKDLAINFCSFLVGKITNIRDRLKDNNRFDVQKKREPRMLDFKWVSESYVQKDNRGK